MPELASSLTQNSARSMKSPYASFVSRKLFLPLSACATPSTIHQFASPIRVQFSLNPFGPSSSVIHPASGDDDDMLVQPASTTTTHATQHAACFMMSPL